MSAHVRPLLVAPSAPIATVRKRYDHLLHIDCPYGCAGGHWHGTGDREPLITDIGIGCPVKVHGHRVEHCLVRQRAGYWVVEVVR